MAKNFLLKDREGRVGGYLQIQQHALRCRLTESAKEGSQKDLILYSNEEQVERFPLASGDAEQCISSFSSEGQTISGAVVVCDECMHLYTDERAVRAYEQSLQKRNRMKKQSEKRMMPVKPKERAQKLQVNLTEQQEIEWPQRRWPPPVCMPHAVYTRGRWVERTEMIQMQD